MIMKRKIGLELIGPCSDTGVTPDPHDTIVLVDEATGRVSFTELEECQIEGPGVFQGRTLEGTIVSSSDCYLLYTTDAVSDVKRDVRRVRKAIRRKL